MSLNWKIDKIKDYKTKCWIKYSPGGKEQLNPVTEVLIWACMAVDLTGITEQNCIEFYTRLSVYEDTFGAFLHSVEGEGDKPVKQPITLQDVRDHIGLSTNVSNKSRAFFKKKVADRLMWEKDRSVRWLEEKDKAA